MTDKEHIDYRRILLTISTPQVEAIAIVAHHEHRRTPIDLIVVLATETSQREGWKSSFVSFLRGLDPRPAIKVVDIDDAASAWDVVSYLDEELEGVLDEGSLDVLVDFTGGLAIHRLGLLLYVTRALSRGERPVAVTVLYADPAVRGVRRISWETPMAMEEVEELRFEISLRELVSLHGYSLIRSSSLLPDGNGCHSGVLRILRNLYDLAIDNPVARGFFARHPRRARRGPGKVAIESLGLEELRDLTSTFLSHDVLVEAMKQGFHELQRAGIRNGAAKAAKELRTMVFAALQGAEVSDLLVTTEFMETQEGRLALKEFVKKFTDPVSRGGIGGMVENRQYPKFQDFRLPDSLVHCLGSWKTGILFEAMVSHAISSMSDLPLWKNVVLAARKNPSMPAGEYDIVGIYPDGRAFFLELKAIRTPISGMRRELVSKVETFRHAAGRYGEAYLLLPFLGSELDTISAGGQLPWLSKHAAAALRQWVGDSSFPLQILGLDQISRF